MPLFRRVVSSKEPLWDAEELSIQEALLRHQGPTLVVLNKVDVIAEAVVASHY